MKKRPRWGSNPQSSDSKSDALSIGPRGHVNICDCFIYIIIYNISIASHFNDIKAFPNVFRFLYRSALRSL